MNSSRIIPWLNEWASMEKNNTPATRNLISRQIYPNTTNSVLSERTPMHDPRHIIGIAPFDSVFKKLVQITTFLFCRPADLALSFPGMER